MINREEVIKLLKTYWPEADYSILNGMAEDIIKSILPAIYEKTREAVSNKKIELYSECEQ
ncbi:MAG: hypothetical protein ABFD50_22300 [Smithella sp.]